MLKYYIWLHELRGVSLKDKHLMLGYFRTPKNLYEATKLDFPKEYKGKLILSKEIKKKGMEDSEHILIENQKYGIQSLTIHDPNYWIKRRILSDVPIILYYKGKIEKPTNGTALIVGTRKATEYGIATAQLICSEYVEKKWTIISGLALGIDSIALQKAINLGGTTYGFITNGLDICYPRKNSRLQEAMINQGAIISPYSVGTPSLKYHFVKRNELMTILSDEVVVVEGGIKSGAVTTGRLGLKKGKKVFAVPNNIFAESSSGCNTLLGEGALPYQLNTSSIKKQAKKSEDMDLNKTAKYILDLLKVIPLSTQELSNKLNINIDRIKTELLALELQGQVRYERDGNWHYIGW